MSITIYEFSTGIDLEGIPAHWWSNKFTGYMNNTLGYIPEAVQDAISDALFDVAEGKATDKPAIIGREVEKQGDAWSVIAVVTEAKDEGGRNNSVSRYFLTQGKGKLGSLVWWYYAEAKKPIFDPFNKPSHPYSYEIDSTKEQNIEKLLNTDNFQKLLKLLDGDEKTIVIPHGSHCAPFGINEIARRQLVKQYLLEAYKINPISEQQLKDFLGYKIGQLNLEEKKQEAEKYLNKIYYNRKVTTNYYLLSPQERKEFIACMVDNWVQDNQIDENIKRIWLSDYKKNNYVLTESDLRLFVQQLINQPDAIQDIFQYLQTSTISSQYLIAWAYNVEGLTKPWSFEVVYPASAEAEEVIKKEKEEGVTTPKPVEGQRDVDVALSNLANQGKVRTSYLDDINKAVAPENQQIYTEHIWENSIFYNLDIQKAKNSSSYPPLYVHLYLLYGLILPQHFASFLGWLARKNSNDQSTEIDADLAQKAIQAKGEEAHYKIALELSEKMNNKLSEENHSHLLNKVSQNIKQLLIKLTSSTPLTQEDELLKEWLLLDQNGLWGRAFQWLMAQLWADIKQIAKNYNLAKAKLDENVKSKTGSRNKMSSVEDIANALHQGSYTVTYASENLILLNQEGWQEMKDYFIDLIWYKDGKSIQNKRFLPLANLLDIITQNKPKPNDATVNTNYCLPAIFYQISTGDVPDPLWKKCQFKPENKDKATIIHDEKSIINLKRRLTEPEKAYGFIVNSINGFIDFWIKTQTVKTANTQRLLFGLLGIILTLVFFWLAISRYPNFPNIGFVKNWLDWIGAVTTFDKTTSVYLDQVVSKYNGKPKDSKPEDGKSDQVPIQENDVQEKLIKVFDKDSDYRLKFQSKNQQPTKWLSAIADKQGQLRLPTTGFILANDDMAKNLNEELKCRLKVPLSYKEIINCKTKYEVSIETPALDQLTSELADVQLNGSPIGDEKVRNTLLSVLGNPSNANKPTNSNKPLKDQIRGFQKHKKLEEDGILTTDGNTYKSLKSEVASQLNITLTNPATQTGGTFSPSTVDLTWKTNVDSLNAIVEDQNPDESEKGKRKEFRIFSN